MSEELDMHSSVYETEAPRLDGAEVLVAIATLVTEGRIPNKLDAKKRGFSEGPHCTFSRASQGHVCSLDDQLCVKYEKMNSYIVSLWQRNIPLCIEVLLVPQCCCKTELVCNAFSCADPIDSAVLLEQWHFNIQHRRAAAAAAAAHLTVTQLMNAVRSQLHFSQLSAWHASPDDSIRQSLLGKSVVYCLTVPGETLGCAWQGAGPQCHAFPTADVGNGAELRVSLSSRSRAPHIPALACHKCGGVSGGAGGAHADLHLSLLDDRMRTYCTLKGKHRCEDYDDLDNGKPPKKQPDLVKQSKGDILLDAILRSSKVQSEGSAPQPPSQQPPQQQQQQPQRCGAACEDGAGAGPNFKRKCAHKPAGRAEAQAVTPAAADGPSPGPAASDNPAACDMGGKGAAAAAGHCDSAKRKRTEGAAGGIPSALEQARFRKSLDSAASMVFHGRTGLPLTSSPAPVRRGRSCFDFDSSITSVSAIRSALFSLQSFPPDEDSESDGSAVSPCSPEAAGAARGPPAPPARLLRRGHPAGLLGSFEESVLNGRLEPVSTVHGFTAELGASGSFCPRHVVLPVTVFFYTLGDNDKVSTPYLGHINLLKKGYNVPKCGTVQVTLFNPLGTVVKMFVIMYDLSDMPASSQTFIRQRTLYMPASGAAASDLRCSQKWLRYLIHLRFLSSKSGRIYLHSDIRMIICRKSDLDTATAHGIDMSYELRSFTHCPSNPKFSPRK